MIPGWECNTQAQQLSFAEGFTHSISFTPQTLAQRVQERVGPASQV